MSQTKKEQPKIKSTFQLRFFDQDDDEMKFPSLTADFPIGDARPMMKVCGSFFMNLLGIGEDDQESEQVNEGMEDDEDQSLKLKPFYNIQAQETFSAFHMCHMFKYLQANFYRFDEDFMRLLPNERGIQSILLEYFDSNLKFKCAGKEDKQKAEFREQITDPDSGIVQHLTEYSKIAALLKCAKFFQISCIEHLCHLSLGCLVYFDNSSQMENKLKEMGIDEEFDEHNEDFMKLYNLMEANKKTHA